MPQPCVHPFAMCFVSLLVLGPSSTVRAGPVEQFIQVMVHDAQPNRIAVRYEQSGGGLIVSSDGGRTFALVCASAITQGARLGTAVMDGDGRLLIASFEGLYSDDLTACGWTADPTLQRRWVSDVAVHPSQPAITFAATSGSNEPNALYRSTDQRAFEPLGKPDDALVTRLRVVERATGVRLYQSVVRGTRTAASARGPIEVANYVIRHTDDLAESWVEHAFAATDGTVRLEAVDPTNPDRLVVSVSRAAGGGTTLFVSRDAGATFEAYLELAALGGVTITPEGRVYAGDAGDPTSARTTRGLYRAASLTEPPKLLTGAYPVHCLSYRASDRTLFACDRYVFGTADLDTGELRPLTKLTSLEHFVKCPGLDVSSRCEAPMVQGFCGVTHFPCAPICDPYAVDLSDLESTARADPSVAACLVRRDPAWQPTAAEEASAPPDPGPPPSAAEAAAPQTSPPDAGAAPHASESSGCRVGGQHEGSTFVGMSLLALAAWLLRKRRA